MSKENEVLIEELKNLTSRPSVSGNEFVYATFLSHIVSPLAGKTYIDSAGNVIAIKGTPEAYLFTHMDTIGFMISSKDADKLGVISIKEKGAKPKDTPWNVNIHTKKTDISAQIFLGQDEKTLGIKHGGRTSDIQVGDFISLKPNFSNDNNIVKSQGLDNRLGILTALKVFEKCTDIGFVSTVGEETTGRGAFKATWDLKPKAVIVLDTTYDESEQGVIGPKIGIGPSICLKDSLFPDSKLVDMLKTSAKKIGISLQYEVLETGFSDANRVHTAWGYTPFVFVGIPIKNMHSPDETADIRDVEYTAKLLTEFFNNSLSK